MVYVEYGRSVNRFFQKVDQSTDLNLCWNWIGAKSRGYGYFWAPEQRLIGAHKWFWEYLHGRVPDNLELDHICRNRACVNPCHLQAITHRQNMQIGEVGTNWNSHVLLTHCRRGHEFTEENIYRRPGSPYRECRQCKVLRKDK